MASRFKKGDVVKCVRGGGPDSYARLGVTFTVNGLNSDGMLLLDGIPQVPYDDERFELVEAAKPGPTTCGVELLNGEMFPQTPDHRGPHGAEPKRAYEYDSVKMTINIDESLRNELTKALDGERHAVAKLEVERQRANHLGDEAGSLRSVRDRNEVTIGRLTDRVADLESQARTDARTIAAYKERVRRLERR